MPPPSSSASIGFQSAKDVLRSDVKSSEGGVVGSSSGIGKRKRDSMSSGLRPLAPSAIENRLAEYDDTGRPFIAKSRPLPQRLPLPLLPQPYYGSTSGWTTAASFLPHPAEGQDQPFALQMQVAQTPIPALQPYGERHHAPVAQTQGPTLSDQQAEILARIMKGESFFFTGSAGTGKSVLLRAIIQAFRKKEGLKEDQNQHRGMSEIIWSSKLGITASTGVSAINIGGSTLHSWAGIGLGMEPIEVLTAKVQNYQAACDRWRKFSALIIDEISMIDGKLLTKLDHIARTIRRSDEPFGGLQLILCGDFFQLPPVAKEGDPPAVYAFDSPAWSTVFNSRNMESLRTVFRQKDADFVRILNEMRFGRMTMPDLRKVQSLDRALKFPDDIPPVELYPTKNDVDRLNSSKLRALHAPSYTYEAKDVPGRTPNGVSLSEDATRKVLDTQTLFLPQIELKVGAIIMLLTNHTDQGLCNGSIGKVVYFTTIDNAMMQGMSKVGMATTEYSVFPVVEFIPGKYVTVPTPKRVIVPCVDITVENPNGTMKAKRVQLPLILAWGLTIHKAQGLSLDRVRIDLARTFANGQAYVALSRATSMEGLQVLNFDQEKLKVSKEVLRWYSIMERESQS